MAMPPTDCCHRLQETHISNPAVRVASSVAPHCRGTVYGFGVDSYMLALEGLRASAWVRREL